MPLAIISHPTVAGVNFEWIWPGHRMTWVECDTPPNAGGDPMSGGVLVGRGDPDDDSLVAGSGPERNADRQRGRVACGAAPRAGRARSVLARGCPGRTAGIAAARVVLVKVRLRVDDRAFGAQLGDVVASRGGASIAEATSPPPVDRKSAVS
jgi:hypothetical protein